MLAVVLSRDMLVTGMITSNWQLALSPPADAIILHEPTDKATTCPVCETIATASLSEDQLTVASLGTTNAAISREPLTGSLYSVGVTDKLVTPPPPPDVTVTAHVALFPPAAAVIVQDPAATAVTTPDEETVATAVELLDHDTVLSVASAGRTVAVNVLDWPTDKLRDMVFSVTDVTGTVELRTVT
jgi:hypothetical protein